MFSILLLEPFVSFPVKTRFFLLCLNVKKPLILLNLIFQFGDACFVEFDIFILFFNDKLFSDACRFLCLFFLCNLTLTSDYSLKVILEAHLVFDLIVDVAVKRKFLFSVVYGHRFPLLIFPLQVVED